MTIARRQWIGASVLSLACTWGLDAQEPTGKETIEVAGVTLSTGMALDQAREAFERLGWVLKPTRQEKEGRWFMLWHPQRREVAGGFGVDAKDAITNINRAWANEPTIKVFTVDGVRKLAREKSYEIEETREHRWHLLEQATRQRVLADRSLQEIWHFLHHGTLPEETGED